VSTFIENNLTANDKDIERWYLSIVQSESRVKFCFQDIKTTFFHVITATPLAYRGVLDNLLVWLIDRLLRAFDTRQF